METRHEFALLNRFDEILLKGAAALSHSELLRWWDRKRIKPAIWRDLSDRWDRFLSDSEEAHAPLRVCQYEAGQYLLVWGEPLEKWTFIASEGPEKESES